MEDACISRVQLVRGVGFFSVCDGHGGVKTAKFLSKMLPNTFAGVPTKKDDTSNGEQQSLSSPKLNLDLNSDECLKHAYLSLDRKIGKKLSERDVSGSTCVTLCIMYKAVSMPKYERNQEKALKSSPHNAGTPPSSKLGSFKKKKKSTSGFPLSTPPSSHHSNLSSSSISNAAALPSGKRSSPLTSVTTRASSAATKQTRRAPKNLKIDVDLTNDGDETIVFTPVGSSSSVDNHHNYGGSKSASSSKTLRFKLICLNTGDSRCILYNNKKTIALSDDHKPTDASERTRIKKAGYEVVMGRVDGMLAVSRAFGDEQFKRSKSMPRSKQAVVATPDIKRVEVEISDSDRDYSFAVLACDGIYDCMTNEEVTKFIVQRMKKYDLWNNDHQVDHKQHLHTHGWYYTHPRDWTQKMVSEWRDTLTLQMREKFPRKSMTGAELYRWLDYESKRHKSITADKFKKIQRYIAFLEEKITRFLNRAPARTTAEKLQIIAENLIDESILVRGSQDNCTVNIVLLHHPNWVHSQVQRAKLNHRQSSESLIGGTPVHSEIDSPANFQLTSPSSRHQNPMMSPKNRISPSQAL
eukprot:CAMPEP_0117435622 /NCGR_PEP_ID=MMETSP0759-20121206/577_1 /TAXON_ID=63605 /ORGANISM="Percolomonas cosmopolitus, Strain WS" /LENGTH=579 /DNA_ID=CAMNT_0005227177 /DNA_START=3235 /DNA_END=4974 /DNA_ORIENTATION=-